MKQQKVIITPPKISVTVGNVTLTTESWQGTIHSMHDLRRRIAESANTLLGDLHSLLLTVPPIVLIQLEELGEQSVTVTLEYLGPTGYFETNISEQALQLQSGKSIPIHYNGQLHITLYRIAAGRLKHKGRSKSVATLIAAGLVGKKWKLATQQGREVLNRLEKQGPPEGIKGKRMIAKELLTLMHTKRVTKDTPLRNWLQRLEGIRVVATQPHTYTVTAYGIEWLEEHSVELIKAMPKHRISLIKFLPLKALGEYLTHPFAEVRKAALQRMEELQGQK